MLTDRKHDSSFRDPCGFLFHEGGKLLRQVNDSGREDYRLLMDSGLYGELTGRELLIRHTELEDHRGADGKAWKVIAPELVRFISYPYEWSFSQLKDAALATLNIQKAALRHGMTLKDASAYNIQFHRGRPVLIDTLSFEAYRESQPWAAYRQFCQHFLAPLALMSRKDLRLNQLLRIYLDGIPLDLASALLPSGTWLNPLLLMHLHLHARSQKKYAHKGSSAKQVRIGLPNLIALVDSLRYMTGRFRQKKQETEWGRYYDSTNYSDRSFGHKKKIVASCLEDIRPATLWDLGANTGEFTQIAAGMGSECIAFDIDPLAVDAHYSHIRASGIENILPLVMDLTNPSPSTGWENRERMSLLQRPRPDLVLALALIHHLAISNNLPFDRIARFLSEIADHLIIEFVPKTDSQVKRLLESRKDIFPGYHETGFEEEFSGHFEIMIKKKIIDSDRIIYLMKRK